MLKKRNAATGLPDSLRRASLSSTDPITWNASLYPVIQEVGNVIKVGNGVKRGWDMKPATVGSASGTFKAPSPTCPPATCSGIGASSVNWASAMICS